MNIQVLMPTDEPDLRLIHDKFYKDEFSFPNFFDKFIVAASVKDKDDNIICAGGVRTICEAVIVTNKDIEIEQRREALLKILNLSEFASGRVGYKSIHAQILNNPKWEQHLIKYGFQKSKGTWLVR